MQAALGRIVLGSPPQQFPFLWDMATIRWFITKCDASVREGLGAPPNGGPAAFATGRSAVCWSERPAAAAPEAVRDLALGRVVENVPVARQVARHLPLGA